MIKFCGGIVLVNKGTVRITDLKFPTSHLTDFVTVTGTRDTQSSKSEEVARSSNQKNQKYEGGFVVLLLVSLHFIQLEFTIYARLD